MTAAALLAPQLDTEPVARPRLVSLQAKAKTQPAQPALELSFVTDRAGFEALETEWNALFERAGRSHQLFLGYNWLWHWCQHYLPAEGAKATFALPASGRTRLSILTGRQDGRLVMVWPLVSERSRGLTVLSWMGDPVSQYGDVLIEDTAGSLDLMRQAWTLLAAASGADLLRLRKVRADSAIQPLLAELGGQVTETLDAPYLDLASAKDFAAYEQRYSGGNRRNRRRLHRRLDEQGTITFDEVTSGVEARALIELAVDLKRKWLTSRGLVSKAYADDRFTRFFSDVAAADQRPAGCRVAVLKSAGRPVAIEVALSCKDRIALHIIVFDLEFEKSGAGVLLLEQSLRNAANSGCACYDLLAPGDTYKMDWADGTVGVEDWALPLSAVGTAYARIYLGFVRSNIKRAVAALPPAVRRRIADGLSRVMTKA